MERREFPQLGETCYFEQLENGLPIFVVSKPGYTKAHACLAVSYGGMHRCFENGTRQETVAGVAHFLEHKMFEMPDGNALQQFSAAGASVNAFTAADMTAYYFTCTDRFPEHLPMLLRFVSTPYFTAESVHKEQGIIAQEIGMDDDDPDWQVYQNLLRGLYHCHPVRESILGTVESIAQITPDTLYTCHRAFYHPGNMVLCVVGDVDPHRVVSIARMVLPSEVVPTARKDYGPQEPAQAYQHEASREMEVSAPNFLLGFKASPFYAGVDGLRQTMVGSLAGELLCGRSSPLYAKLYTDGLIHKDFSVTCICYPGAAFLVAGGESPDPRRVRKAVLQEGERLSQGIDEERFRRAVKHEYGATVRSLNSFDSICVQLSRWWFSGCHYFDFAALYPTLTAAETAAFLGETVREAGSCLSMIQPKGANTL